MALQWKKRRGKRYTAETRAVHRNGSSGTACPQVHPGSAWAGDTRGRGTSADGAAEAVRSGEQRAECGWCQPGSRAAFLKRLGAARETRSGPIAPRGASKSRHPGVAARHGEAAWPPHSPEQLVTALAAVGKVHEALHGGGGRAAAAGGVRGPRPLRPGPAPPAEPSAPVRGSGRAAPPRAVATATVNNRAVVPAKGSPGRGAWDPQVAAAAVRPGEASGERVGPGPGPVSPHGSARRWVRRELPRPRRRGEG